MRKHSIPELPCKQCIVFAICRNRIRDYVTAIKGDSVIIACDQLHNYIFRPWSTLESSRREIEKDQRLIDEAKEYFKCKFLSVHIGSARIINEK